MSQASTAFEQVSHATDQELIAKLIRLARADRALSVRLLVHLAEVDARRLYRDDARGYLELHHEVPFARGGEATVANLKLLCRTHNALLAERDLGEQFMRRKLREARNAWLFSEREQG